MSPRISWKQLKNLPVVTQSGYKLGVIVDVEIDIEEHVIKTYLVAPRGIARTLVRSLLRIDQRQVISITPEKMIVEDAARHEGAEERTARPQLAKDISPVVPFESS